MIRALTEEARSQCSTCEVGVAGIPDTGNLPLKHILTYDTNVVENGINVGENIRKVLVITSIQFSYYNEYVSYLFPTLRCFF